MVAYDAPSCGKYQQAAPHSIERDTYHDLMLAVVEIGGISSEHKLVASYVRAQKGYSPWEDGRAFEALMRIKHRRRPLPNAAVRAPTAILLTTSSGPEIASSGQDARYGGDSTHGSGCQFLKPIFAPSS